LGNHTHREIWIQIRKRNQKRTVSKGIGIWKFGKNFNYINKNKIKNNYITVKKGIKIRKKGRMKGLVLSFFLLKLFCFLV